MSDSQNKDTSIIQKICAFIKRFYGNHPIISHMILICLTGMLLIYCAFIFFDIFTRHGSTTTVPAVRNLTLDEARTLVASNDLVIEIADSLYDDNLPPGTVKEVWPGEGSIVKPGTTIFVSVTSFQPKVITIKDPIEGVSSRQAISYLSKNNIKDVRIVHVPGQFADLVIRALYNGHDIHPGMKIPVNATITLEVGSGFSHDSDSLEELDTYNDDEDDDFTLEEVTSPRNETPTATPEPAAEPDDMPDIFN